MADYLLFDLLDTIEALSPAHGPRLAASLPRLVAWRGLMRGRPGLAAYLASDRRRPA